MDQDLHILVQLQRVDSTIDLLLKRRDGYPHRIGALEDELKKTEQELTAEQERRSELEKEQRHFERELQNANHELDKHNKRLFEVKTNKEYQALLQEIEVQKNRIEEFESQILERMTALDDLAETIKGFEAEFGKKKDDTSQKIEECKSGLASVENELAIQQREREKLLSDADAKLIKNYERVRKKNKGFAVVPVQKEACGGCFERLPPQRINEIRRNDGLIHCENCGSILVWDEEGLLNSYHNLTNMKERPEQNR